MPEPTAVLVPVMRRPQNAAPFMDSLRAADAGANVYAVVDEGDWDTITAWRAAGAFILYDQHRPGRGGTFAEKVNVGYACTDEPWLFITGDDVRFRTGWLDWAQAHASAGAKVIGTNDLANPRVIAGDHATHLLIARSYVDSQGASWDGPGVLAHEGYRHWYVDDEIVTVAKQRGVWEIALTSIVEHMHPLFGKGVNDDVYRLGQSFADQDRELFEKRLAEYAR